MDSAARKDRWYRSADPFRLPDFLLLSHNRILRSHNFYLRPARRRLPGPLLSPLSHRIKLKLHAFCYSMATTGLAPLQGSGLHFHEFGLGVFAVGIMMSQSLVGLGMDGEG